MKIAFVQDTVNQSVGIMYLSSVLKSEGHHCELFVEPLESDLLKSVRYYEPDIIGFGVITGAHHWALRTAGRLKEIMPKALVILGGPHPTYFPEIVQDPAVDIVARGEAEISFLELARRIEGRQNYTGVSGIWVKANRQVYRNDVAPLVENISALPFPDHKLYLKYNFYKKQTEVPFSTARGCPFRCSFCYNHVKAMLYKGKGQYVRLREVEDVIGEMKMARNLYPNMHSVILYDDIIGVNRKWLSGYSEEYAKHIGMPWFTSIRADVVDEFTAEALGKANCFCLSIGVETGDEELRTKVLCKKIPDDQYIKAASLLHKAGVKVRTSNMLFLPGEDLKKALKTVDINRQMKVDFAWAYTMQPYPGTDIYDYAVKNGYLSPAFQFDDIDPLGLIKPIVEIQDEKKILVVHRLFHFCVHNTVMRRLINILVFIPPNPLFDMLYYLSLILSYAEYHQVSVYRAMRIAWTNYRGTKKATKK